MRPIHTPNLQAATQLACVPEIDELLAPTDGRSTTQRFDSVRSAFKERPDTARADLVTDIGALVEEALYKELDLSAAQHVVPQLSDMACLGGLSERDHTPSALARDLGVGDQTARSGDNLWEMGIPLRV